MAKRNIRKTDPDTTSAPDRREISAADPNGRAAAPKASRSSRKAAAPVAAATQPEPATEVTPITAEGALETPATIATSAPATREEDQPRPAAPSFTTVAEVAAVQLSHDQIAERAYHLYLERDRQPGDPFADWLTAERELRARFVGA
jgi:Protein of unknown function (DUF2934)